MFFGILTQRYIERGETKWRANEMEIRGNRVPIVFICIEL
jgi:hypothetical protein